MVIAGGGWGLMWDFTVLHVPLSLEGIRARNHNIPSYVMFFDCSPSCRVYSSGRKCPSAPAESLYIYDRSVA